MMACDVCENRAVHTVSQISQHCDYRVKLRADVQDVSDVLKRRKDYTPYMKMNLRDGGPEPAKIEALAFRDNVWKFRPLIKENQSYEFRNFNVNTVKKKYPDLDHPCELWLEDVTTVQKLNYPVVDTSPYVPFKDLEPHLFSNHIRVIGILTNEGTFMPQRETAFGRKDFRRIRLMDKHGEELDVSLWAAKASEVNDGHRGSVVAVKGVKVGWFNGNFSLSSTYRTIIEISPDIPEAAELRELKLEFEDRDSKRAHDDESDASDCGDGENRKKRRGSNDENGSGLDDGTRTMETEECERMSSIEERSDRDEYSEEISGLDSEMLEKYIKALRDGEEEQTSVRVMIIGHTRAGKTTLTKNILQLDIPDREESTNGIDVHVYHANMVDGKLQIQDTSNALEEGKRLAKVTKQKSDQNISSIVSVESDMPTLDDVPDSGYGSMSRTSSTISELASNSFDSAASEKVGSRHSTESEANLMAKITRQKKSEVDSALPQQSLPSRNSIQDFQKGLESNEDTSRMLSVWDFGGQFGFYVTHQLFLSDYAIYILVLDLTKGLDANIVDDFSNDTSRDVETFCKFWLETIHAFVGNSSGNPPVVLVGTRFDELDDNKDKEKIAKAKFEEVMALFDKSPVQRHIHYERFYVSKNQSQVEISNLMTCITNLATMQPHKMPARWIPLENDLLEMKKKHITFDDLCQLAKEKVVPIKDQEELKGFLTFQHRKGNIIYFPEEGLSDIVVLNPQWIVDAFKCIITKEEFSLQNASLRPLWQELKTKAMLKPALSTALWENDNTNDFGEYKDVLLLFLQQLGVISGECKVNIDDITQGDDPKSDESQDSGKCYIVPSKLQKDSCGRIKELERSNKSKTLPFVFCFRNGFVPATLYHKVIASAVSIWKLYEWEGESMLYKDGVVFILDLQHVGEIVLTPNSIDICVLNLTEDSEEYVDHALSNKLRRFVERIISEELNRFRNGTLKSHYDLAFRCDEDTCKKPRHLINSIKKQKKSKVHCSGIRKKHNISVDRLMAEWFPNETLRNGFVLMMRNNPASNKFLSAEMTNKIVNRVVTAIESTPKELGAALGIDNAELERIAKEDLVEQTRKRRLILMWRQAKTCQDFLKVLDENPGIHVNKDQLLNVFDNLC